MIEPVENDRFFLGITMAGAISAGCYTGGVMDYLFELLDIWEKAKKGEHELFADFKDLIPPHQIVIEAVGGASAGGMTTTMASIYALEGKINPVTVPGQVAERKGNIFYDNWVLMDDFQPGVEGNTFSKLWSTDDLKEGKLQSLLNSSFVDRIADGVFPKTQADIAVQTANLPGYISKDLQMILSHTLLRGMPMEVDFQTPIARKGRKSITPNHTTYEHYIVSHYHLNQGKAPNRDQYLFLNPYEKTSAQTLKLATIATGAFPVGLMYREFDDLNFSDNYLKTIYKRIISGKFGMADPDPENDMKFRLFPKQFSSVTVDGGAINNEPYREVMSLLSDHHGISKSDSYPDYGVIMIDPFPDQGQFKAAYERATDLVDVIPEILDTLQDQSRVKRREMLEGDPGTFYRSIIFPRKWSTEAGKTKPIKNPIACASVGAFGGFLDIKFRQHDFFLGRDNARNFFRYFFSMPYDKAAGIVHPIHSNWTDAMVEKFKIEKDGKVFLPIVPDLYLLMENDSVRKERRYQYTVPQMPIYNPEQLFSFRKSIEQRFLRIIEILWNRNYITKKEDNSILAKSFMEKYYRKGMLAKLGGWIAKICLKGVYLIAKRPIAKSVTEKIIRVVLTDLESKGLIK